MELSSTGRIFLWFDITLLVFFVMFRTPAALAIAIALFLYLVYEGLSFRGTVNVGADSLYLKTVPSELQTRVAHPVNVVTTLTNSSERKLAILGAKRNLPVGITEKLWTPPLPCTLNPHGQLSLTSELDPGNAGNFVASKFSMTLGSRRKLFQDHMILQDRFCVVVRPAAARATNPIDTSSLTDIMHEESRRGVGTDFAGLRPATYLDGPRAIDWKAVARFRRLYARDFYLDEEPPIMLLVDASLISGLPGSLMLEQLHALIANIQVANALGLVLFDFQSVVVMIPPGRGSGQRGKLSRALLRSHGTTYMEKSALPHQLTYSNEISSLSALAAFEDSGRPHLRRLGLFARTALPYYSYAETKRSDRLREQGNYLAFRAVAELPQRVLVVAIADGRVNIEGLVEGAKLAVRSNHEVALTLLSIDPTDFRLVLEYTTPARSIIVARSTPNDLVRVINSEIIERGHKRGS